MKIAEHQAPPKEKGVGHALKTMAVGAAGGALGFGAAELLSRKMKFFNPATATTPAAAESRLRAARIILPILSGASVMLANRYRQKMNDEYSKTKGYEGKK